METKRLFLPWVRRGLSGSLEAPSSSDSLPMRAGLDIKTTLGIGASQGDVSERREVEIPELSLLGPGDVRRLSSNAVLRNEPPDGTPDFFPNQVPTVEFAEPDLPWMFTPTGPDNDDHLRPWIVLVCVAEQPGVVLRFDPDRGPVLSLDSSADDADFKLTGPGGALPDLGESWAWAHAEVTGMAAPTANTTETFDAVERRHPERTISRLICPVNLEAARRYICAVVPAFEAGRLAALNEPLGAVGGEPAWTSDPITTLELPVFHHWRFTTTRDGDFEALARLLTPRGVDDPVGTRPVDIQRTGLLANSATIITREPITPPVHDHADLYDFPVQLVAAVTTGRVESALRPIGSQATDNQDASVTQAYRDIFAKRSVEGRPTIGPPVYGQWHADRAREDVAQEQADDWVNTLNTSISNRTAAGAGAKVVRDKQEAFMERAWSQYGAIEQINAVLAQGQLSREVGRTIYERHVEVPKNACSGLSAPSDLFLSTVGPLVQRVRMPSSSMTVAEQVEEWALPPSVFRPGFRRGLAQAGPIGSDVISTGLPNRRNILANTPLGAPQDFELGAPQNPERDEHKLSPDIKDAIERIAFPDMFVSPPFEDNPPWNAVNAALCEGLDPSKTIPKRIRSRFPESVLDAIGEGDPLQPIVTQPVFDEPFYTHLKALSPDWILSGLSEVPPNTITLLETNPDFLESVLVGACDEMNAEMLYRGFPTDRTGTPFRQFWDRPGTSAEAAADISPIAEWQDGSALGSHRINVLAAGSTDAKIVFLLRGDLLKRFPRTMIYAQRATRIGGDLRLHPSAAPIFPDFRGTLDPDVTFLGFNLTQDDVFSQDNHDGYFFMIEGQPLEPRFGLDETLNFEPGTQAARDYAEPVDPATPNIKKIKDWNTIYWGDLLGGKNANDTSRSADALRTALSQLSHIPIEPENETLAKHELENVVWGKNAAHMAYILLQLDVRLALHADVLRGNVQ